MLEDVSEEHARKTVTMEPHPHGASGVQVGRAQRRWGCAARLAQQCGWQQVRAYPHACQQRARSGARQQRCAAWLLAPLARAAAIRPCQHAYGMRAPVAAQPASLPRLLPPAFPPAGRLHPPLPARKRDAQAVGAGGGRGGGVPGGAVRTLGRAARCCAARCA